MRIVVFILTLLVASVVQADCELSSARLGNALIKVGDAERKVLRNDPDRTVQLERREGGAAGIRYDFYLRGKTLQVYVRNGRISRICHLKD